MKAIRNIIGSLLLITTSSILATEVAQYGGVYSYWPATWTAIASLNDPGGDVSRPSSDFYSGSGSTAYYAMGGNYIYYRMRINYSAAIGAGTLSDSYFIFVDWSNGVADGVPDFAFTWDARSNDNTRHGLEMTKRSVGGATDPWGNVRMNDIDGLSGQKGTVDFGGAGNAERTGDGYIRTIDGAVGGGAFVDFAISFDYLKNTSGTGLGLGQDWRIALGTIPNANDHNVISGDVAGGSSPTNSVTTGWAAVPTPEPGTTGIMALGMLFFMVRSRCRLKRTADTPGI